jgi:hypothetical protein
MIAAISMGKRVVTMMELFMLLSSREVEERPQK